MLACAARQPGVTLLVQAKGRPEEDFNYLFKQQLLILRFLAHVSTANSSEPRN